MSDSLDLMHFQEWFADQDACMAYLARLRWSEGHRCPRCGWSDYYYHTVRQLYQCARCKHQASVISGTIFNKTRVSLPKWFYMIFLLGRSRGRMPILQIAPILNISYRSAWAMAAKIKKAIGGKEELRGIEIFDLGAFDRVLTLCLRTGALKYSDVTTGRRKRLKEEESPPIEEPQGENKASRPGRPKKKG